MWFLMDTAHRGGERCGPLFQDPPVKAVPSSIQEA